MGREPYVTGALLGGQAESEPDKMRSSFRTSDHLYVQESSPFSFEGSSNTSSFLLCFDLNGNTRLFLFFTMVDDRRASHHLTSTQPDDYLYFKCHTDNPC